MNGFQQRRQRQGGQQDGTERPDDLTLADAAARVFYAGVGAEWDGANLDQWLVVVGVADFAADLNKGEAVSFGVRDLSESLAMAFTGNTAIDLYTAPTAQTGAWEAVARFLAWVISGDGEAPVSEGVAEFSRLAVARAMAYQPGVTT